MAAENIPMESASSLEFPIGTQFRESRHNGHARICTVIDILRTYNNAGVLVRTRYVATHEFAGQIVTDQTVDRVTIAKGRIIAPLRDAHEQA